MFINFINKILNFFKGNKKQKPKNKKTDFHDYVPKIVKQNNKILGETIAFEKNRIIVKTQNSYKAISIESIIENNEIIVVSEFDEKESLKLGKEWFEKKDTLEFDENGMLKL